ncbi:MAG TPA: IS1182 family transposase [Pseudolabrys sp.]|nr:IS1182 family transposase [Pseudolabrys sp.]
MAGHIVAADRTERMLLPPTVDEFIGKASAVRVIDAFVSSLDLHALGFARAHPALTGRPGYEPGMLLRLYIYGYLNQLRSSRRLEKACRINLELIWLLGWLAPDFKTIADFRRDNHVGITGACRAFVRFCRDAQLFDGAAVVIDGSKVAAAASRKKVRSAAEVAAEVVALDRKIAGYLAALDVADATEHDDNSDSRTAEALKQLKRRRAELLELAAAMAAEERELGVLGELEARPMGSGKGAKRPSYNVQTAVDPKSHIIVHHDVTTEATDNRLLHPIARAAKAVLGADALTSIADKGYANASHAAACEADAITPAVPAPKPTNPRGDFYPPDVFTYDAGSDSYTCPAGRKLLRHGINERDQAYCYRAETCSGCPLKQDCTTAARRYVYRSMHYEAMQRMTARAAQDPTLMKLRRCTVEHPFGTLKQYLGGRFLLRGRLRAATETALAVLGYNLGRASRLLGQTELIGRLA